MTGSNIHLTLHVHLVNGRVYWAVMERNPRLDTLIANGVLDDPYPAEGNPRGSVLMEAAYAAYRVL